VSQPFGDSYEETANLHYAALLLRTVDLLHVTKDRTPSMAFRLIDPTDPFSQEEWHKQMAVVTVRSKIALDREGHADPTRPRDTIEVHAFFTNSRGFFALTRYMRYVSSELKHAHDWCRDARSQKGVIHEFPWRYVDDSNIETEGFLSKQFEFTLDQAKILDLLTGHTLYNSIDVVIRELIQNSLDAVRFAAVIEGSGQVGSVKITWNSESRVLIVEDQGTGMTQDIIERHLLKVGSSRYQDSEFKKQYPKFSPISPSGLVCFQHL
jgi:molecular chaperone HtpG